MKRPSYDSYKSYQLIYNKLQQLEEDLEEVSGRGDRDWFEEGGCPETRPVEGRSVSNCRRTGVNPAISVKGTTPDKN